MAKAKARITVIKKLVEQLDDLLKRKPSERTVTWQIGTHKIIRHLRDELSLVKD